MVERAGTQEARAASSEPCPLGQTATRGSQATAEWTLGRRHDRPSLEMTVFHARKPQALSARANRVARAEHAAVRPATAKTDLPIAKTFIPSTDRRLSLLSTLLAASRVRSFSSPINVNKKDPDRSKRSLLAIFFSSIYWSTGSDRVRSDRN